MYADVAIIGAGAAGLAAAIFAARHHPHLNITLIEGARRPGAKILVSGGGRCNVTNQLVTPADYFGGSRKSIGRVLAALPVERTIEFFREIGVALHLEERGKYFPDSNQARTVLRSLLDEAERRGVRLVCGRRVAAIERGDDCFRIRLCSGGSPAGAGDHDHGDPAFAAVRPITVRAAATPGMTADDLVARRVVLATGGLSLPKTGSDGAGYEFARALGHAIVPTTPGLAPLTLAGDWHVGLSGIAHDVELTIRPDGRPHARIAGPMLWTHFGVSGPAAMDASRVWHRARLEQRPVRVGANLVPGERFESLEAWLLEHATATPTARFHHVLGRRLPQRLVDAVLASIGLPRDLPLAHLPRESRRRLIHALLDWPLEVTGSRGYAHAEVTAGGVPLSEIDTATMESRVCPGLHLVGEILDVDGRIGGFNFQWAWASGHVAGRAVGAAR